MKTRTMVSAAALLLAVGATSALGQDSTRLIDPNKKFHRLFVSGDGDNADENKAMTTERDLIKSRVTAAGNQAAGSTVATLTTPTVDQFRDAITAAFAGAGAGDEVTIYFGGHGGTKRFARGDEGNEPTGFNQHIRLKPDNRVTDNEFRTMIENARTAAGLSATDVTVMAIFDTCYGGGFTGGDSNIGETGHITVIGSKTDSPFSTPKSGGGYWKKSITVTLSEYVQAHAGESVSGTDVKAALNGFNLGPPPAPASSPKTEKSRYEGDDALTDLVVTTDLVNPLLFELSGNTFTPGSLVQLLYFSDETGPDGIPIGEMVVDGFGAFGPVDVLLPSTPLPNAFFGAIDDLGMYDWEVVPAPGTAVVLAFAGVFCLGRRRRG